jgi:hypothetical protein
MERKMKHFKEQIQNYLSYYPKISFDINDFSCDFSTSAKNNGVSKMRVFNT